MHFVSKFLVFLFVCSFLQHQVSYAQTINRKELVQRHNIHVKRSDSLSSLTVGNGAFAFTVDVTGLQSFPEYYKTGVSLGTQSEWGWHSFPNTGNYKLSEAYKEYDLNGRKVSYCVQVKSPQHNKEAVEYFRINDHRLQLGNIGLDIIKKDGKLADIKDIENIDQQIDLWTGIITSNFTVENVPVKVITCAAHETNAIACSIESPLLKEGRIKIRIRFPYPNGQFKDEGTFYGNESKHSTTIEQYTNKSVSIRHKLDATEYYTSCAWSTNAEVKEIAPHYFNITPQRGIISFEFSTGFSSIKGKSFKLPFNEIRNSSISGWAKYWNSGAAVDFAGSTDPRAFELERRVILSQYLTKVQCAGNYPPQETGLTYNSWFGKPHIEMYWWHAAHFALWGRTELLEKSMNWYFTSAAGAKAIAERQGYDGVRWQKMTNNKGEESPSSVGAFLIWQQPHFIYLAELIYRDKKDKATLEKYKDLLFATADFMVSFPTYDSIKKHYNLGKGLIPAQECFEAVETYNPTYELAYWSWALATAQQWRERLGMPRDKNWDKMLKNLAPLPEKNGVYLATESTPDCYEPGNRRLNDHPAVLATLSTIPPAHGLDTAAMHRTFDLVEKVWNWDQTWGWDFPLVAMTATRLQQPEKAVNALFKNIKTNTYLPNGHNYQDDRLTIYLPGNGGILSAIALMCAGPEGSNATLPGFPKDGTWKVRWEGLKQMP
jgi:hypothetical protein